MAKKKAFALRVNEDMLKAIEKWAADDFRSTNGQIEWMLAQALKDAKRDAPKKVNFIDIDDPIPAEDQYGTQSTYDIRPSNQTEGR